MIFVCDAGIDIRRRQPVPALRRTIRLREDEVPGRTRLTPRKKVRRASDTRQDIESRRVSVSISLTDCDRLPTNCVTSEAKAMPFVRPATVQGTNSHVVAGGERDAGTFIPSDESEVADEVAR